MFLTTLNMPIKFSSFSRSHQTTKVYACNLPKSCRLQIQISKFTEFFPCEKRRIRCYKIGQVFFLIFWQTIFILPSMIFVILRTDIKNRRENHMYILCFFYQIVGIFYTTLINYLQRYKESWVNGLFFFSSEIKTGIGDEICPEFDGLFGFWSFDR